MHIASICDILPTKSLPMDTLPDNQVSKNLPKVIFLNFLELYILWIKEVLFNNKWEMITIACLYLCGLVWLLPRPTQDGITSKQAQHYFCDKDKVLSAFVLYNGFSSTNYDTICSLSLTTFHQIVIQSNKP